MSATFRTRLLRRVAELLMAISALAVFSGCATQPASTVGRNATLAKARLSLAEARKARSEPKTAVGRYLDAAGAAVQSANAEPSEARLIYNAACQEAAVQLRSSPELWNRSETVASPEGSYRLRFAAGSREAGTWNPGYFDFFRTPRQVHAKVAHQEARLNDWGGCWWGSTNLRTQGSTSCRLRGLPSRSPRRSVSPLQVRGPGGCVT